MLNNGFNIKQAAQFVGVKYENAKAIFRTHRKNQTDGRNNQQNYVSGQNQ